MKNKIPEGYKVVWECPDACYLYENPNKFDEHNGRDPESFSELVGIAEEFRGKQVFIKGARVLGEKINAKGEYGGAKEGEFASYLFVEDEPILSEAISHFAVKEE